MSSAEPFGDLERFVFEIAKGVWSDTGETFFRSLVRQLSHALQADCVLVGALQPGGEKIRTLAVHTPGGEPPAFEYELTGTPCANVVEKRACSYAEGGRHSGSYELKSAAVANFRPRIVWDLILDDGPDGFHTELNFRAH